MLVQAMQTAKVAVAEVALVPVAVPVARRGLVPAGPLPLKKLLEDDAIGVLAAHVAVDRVAVRGGVGAGIHLEVMRETGCDGQALFAKGQVMLPPLWRLELRYWHRTCQRFEISSSEYSPYMSHFAPFIRRGLLLHCVSSTQ